MAPPTKKSKVTTERAETAAPNGSDVVEDGNSSGSSGVLVKAKERQEKFKQLKVRLNRSAAENKREMFAEFRRQKTDPAAVARLERKKADAELELAKEEAKDEGEDYERKRAWDWTIEESEKWDERLERKRKAKESVQFADYAQAAERAYERELRNFKPDVGAYLTQKKMALQKSGQLIETEDGSIIPLNGDNSFYGDINSLDFADNKPPKEAVDRLVKNIRKADEQRMKKNRRIVDDGDVMSINDKNKKFNAKLSRYYDKYTKEIRDSFERGTAM
ncbi:SYF2 splicing factor-domain-containing protein [Lipomyces chichibuensis]|uniref:SYF2 splicing factor-domain-containing protein n=1 Tax=Lipomyces chichibuensis TaxID=1546026 RepID=UPI003343B633